MKTLLKFKDPGQKNKQFKGIIIENTDFSSIPEFKLVRYYVNEYGTYDSEVIKEIFVGPQTSLKMYVEKLENEIQRSGFKLSEVFIDEYSKKFILDLFN